MRNTSLAVAAVCATLLWPGVVHAQRFTDNGDGTVTDHQTGLMWEKKTPAGSGGVHDVNNKYTWCNGADLTCTNRSNLADGTVFTVFLATLNNGASESPNGCFSNYCDWRIPSLAELKSIFDPNRAAYCPTGTSRGPPPCIDPAFGPTQLDYYSSATTIAGNSIYESGVNFGNGGSAAAKPSGWYVRAVVATANQLFGDPFHSARQCDACRSNPVPGARKHIDPVLPRIGMGLKAPQPLRLCPTSPMQ